MKPSKVEIIGTLHSAIEYIEKLERVVEAARESERQFKAIDDGFFTGQIPSEFTPLSIALRELESEK